MDDNIDRWIDLKIMHAGVYKVPQCKGKNINTSLSYFSLPILLFSQSSHLFPFPSSPLDFLPFLFPLPSL